jgi:hypothetical protein
MRKTSHYGSLIIFLCVASFLCVRADNTMTSWPTPNPLDDCLISENFQDWPNTRTYSSDTLKCNDNNRVTQFNWTNMKFRRLSGVEGYHANIYLHNCEVQPFCDTQSGTYNMQGLNTGLSTYLGPNNPGVSRGNITILDTTTINGVPYNAGYVIIGKARRVYLIQYTISSFGVKRGFRLDYSTDNGQTWTLLRNETGQANADSSSTSMSALTNSPKGTVWEEQVVLKNAMLRFSRAKGKNGVLVGVYAQLFRIHDLRIYGLALGSDMDDSEFEAASGISWVETGINSTRVNSFPFVYRDGILSLSDLAQNIQIFNVSGQCVRSFENLQIMNVSDLNKGVYIVRATWKNGQTNTGKFLI